MHGFSYLCFVVSDNPNAVPIKFFSRRYPYLTYILCGKSDFQKWHVTINTDGVLMTRTRCMVSWCKLASDFSKLLLVRVTVDMLTIIRLSLYTIQVDALRQLHVYGGKCWRPVPSGVKLAAIAEHSVDIRNHNLA